jgi:hypothetical protein
MKGLILKLTALIASIGYSVNRAAVQQALGGLAAAGEANKQAIDE